MALSPEISVVGVGLALALIIGVAAASWPAFVAMRKPIVESLRT